MGGDSPRRLAARKPRVAGAKVRPRPAGADQETEGSPLPQVRRRTHPGGGVRNPRRQPAAGERHRAAGPRQAEDALAAEYRLVLKGLSGKISAVRSRLKRAKRPSTRKRLNRTLYTLYVNRGQIKRTLAYMASFERLISGDIYSGRLVDLTTRF